MKLYFIKIIKIRVKSSVIHVKNPGTHGVHAKTTLYMLIKKVFHFKRDYAKILVN